VGKRISVSAWVFLLSWVLILGLCSCAGKEEKLADFLARGDRLVRENDPVRAILAYKNALQIDPKNARAALGLGRAYLMQKDYQRAFTALNSALELDPALDEARVEVAWMLAQGRQGERALQELAQLQRPEVFRPRIDLVKARALLGLQRHAEAADVLLLVTEGDFDKDVQMMLARAWKATGAAASMEQAARKWCALDPGDSAPYLFLAQDAADRGDKELAARHLKSMTDSNAGKAQLALLRAEGLEHLGLLKEAEIAYQELPGEPDMLKAQAAFWVRMGQRDCARTLMRDIVQANPEDVDAVLNLAQLQAEDSRMPEALDLLQGTLKTELKKGERERVLIAVAAVKARQGEWEQAKKICSSVTRENQANLDAHLLLGKIFLLTQNPKDAEVHLHQVAVARPGDEEANSLLARSYLLNGKELLAAETLKRALENNPENSRLRTELVRYLVGKKEFEPAARTLDKGLELRPRDLSLLKNRGEFAAARKDYARAAQDFRRITEVRPELPLGYLEMGQLLLVQNQPEEARRWFRLALERKNGWQSALPAMVQTYLVNGEPDKAIEFLRGEIQKHPESAQPHFHLGRTYQTRARFQEAEEAFLKTVQLAPEWSDAYRGLAEVYLHQAKLDEAITRFEEMARTEPHPFLLIQLAVLYDLAGRHGDAIRICNELLAESSHSPEMLNNLAYLYAEQAADQATLSIATNLVAQSLMKDEANPNYLDTAAWVAFKQGDLDSAWNYIRDALAQDPDQGAHNLHAAMIAFERGERAQASEYLNRALQLELDQKSKTKALALRREWDGK
jgi:tetratricopeptide (TPR) repeat protein